MLKWILYVGVLLVSFFVTLWFLDRNDAAQRLRWLGTKVTFDISAQQQPEVCATMRSTIRFTGKICGVDGQDISVFWTSLANITNAQPSCGPGTVVRWDRRENDPAYNARFLGSCGVRPEYFKSMPAKFGINTLHAFAE